MTSTLSRLAALVAGVALLAAAPTAHAAAFIKYDGVDGESHHVPLDGLDIDVGGTQRIGLLLPAVQKARDAAARSSLLRAHCEGTVLPSATIEVGPAGRATTIVLTGVVVTSYGVRVGSGDVTGDGTPDIITGAGTGGGPRAVETVTIEYAGLELIRPGIAETFAIDCSTGTCDCAPTR